MRAPPARTSPHADALDRSSVLPLAATAYDRFLALLRTLDPADWSRPTDCPAWDVRAIAGHIAGEMEMVSGVRHLVRQNLAARRAGGGVDALTALQVREQAVLTPPELLQRMVELAPRALSGRQRLSRLAGRLPLPEKQVVGDQREWWTLGFVVDVILTRDPWMHRIDIARAVGREPHVTADHDGRIVAGVVAEWAQRHGQPYRLHLTGPAGGTWSAGDSGPELELDAVEFCRVVSGRGPAAGLLAQQVPF